MYSCIIDIINISDIGLRLIVTLCECSDVYSSACVCIHV